MSKKFLAIILIYSLICSPAFAVVGGSAGWGGSASYSQSKGEGKGSTTDHIESTISDGTGVDFISGNDTNIKGGQIIGDKVTGLVGGDLNIISEQVAE